jgi:TonB family protein
MRNHRIEYRSAGSRRASGWLKWAVALGMIAALAIPARAADDRAVKSRVPPVYPEIAKRMKITGEVVLSVTVNAEGKVTNVKKVSGNNMLSIAAQDAVNKWRFEPGAGDSTVEVTLNFALGQ